ncbi:hypothetical protein OHB11_40265 (plasmid) [Streptomyces zaomyceticus]
MGRAPANSFHAGASEHLTHSHQGAPGAAGGYPPKSIVTGRYSGM